MAISPEDKDFLVSLYVGYFNRAPDPAGLQFWIDQVEAGRDTNTIAADFAASPEAKSLYPFLTTPDVSSPTSFITSVYANLFNRAPDAAGLEFWEAQLSSGAVSAADAIDAIIKGATTAPDSTILSNKVAVGLDFATDAGNTPGFTFDLNGASGSAANSAISGVTEDAATVTAAQAATDAFLNGTSNVGQSFTLTAGVDEVTGTDANDTFRANFDVEAAGGGGLHTLGALDELDGGDGTDTLRITNDQGAYSLPTGISISNIETITMRVAGDVDADTSGSNITGLETLAVRQAEAVDLTASDSQNVTVAGATGEIDVSGGLDVTVTDAEADNDINIGETVPGGENPAGAVTVTDTDQGTGAIEVDGGTDVTIEATTDADGEDVTSGAISVGANEAASGAVSIVQNLITDGGDDDHDDLDSDTIDVVGGSTVDVTVNATNTAGDVDADGDIQIGAVNVTSDGNTTAVSVTQNATATTFVEAEVESTGATHTITFDELEEGDTVEVDGLEFTAATDLTAEEVAAAFAGLTETDTQDDGGPVANGVYNGQLLATWTSGEADGATVVFTSSDDNPGALSLSADGIASDEYEQGEAGTPEDESENEIEFGDVFIDEDGVEDASITNVTLNGFGNATIGDTNALAALATVSLTNSAGDIVIDNGDEATSLDLTVNDITGSVDIDNSDASVETLNLTATGEASEFDLTAEELTDLNVTADADLDLGGSTLGSLENVTITGAGAVDLGDISDEDNLDSFDASANTGGVTASDVQTAEGTLDGDLETYVFSAGDDVVGLSETDVDVDIDLGAGDDEITLASGTTSLDGSIDAGDGTDTLVMDAADADAASADDDFEGQISGFEKLEVNALQQGDGDVDVDLANMDDIDYVIVNGGDFEAITGSDEVSTVTFEDLLSGQSITIAGLTYTASDDVAAADVATAFAGVAAGGSPLATEFSGTLTGYSSGMANGNELAFTAETAGNIFPDLSVNEMDAQNAAPSVVTNEATDAATNQGVNAAEASVTITVDGLLNTETLTIGVAASGTEFSLTAGVGGLTAEEVALAVASADFSGTDLADYSVTNVSGTTITLEAGTAEAKDPLIASTDSTVFDDVSVDAQDVGADAETEIAAVTFTDLLSGQSVEVAGVTVLATDDLTGAEVASIFSSKTAGTDLTGDTTVANATVTGTLTDWNAGAAAGAKVLFTDDTGDRAVTDLEADLTRAGDPTDFGVVTEQGGQDAATLTLSNMADGGTVELTSNNSATNEVTVEMEDASGDDDSLNIVIEDAFSDNFGTVTANDVETINIDAIDTFVDANDDGEDDFDATHDLTVDADSVETIVVTGDDLDLTVDNADELTSVDASALTGGLVYTADGSSDGTTVLGGEGDDDLTADGSDDVLNGGAGDDTLTGDDNTTLSGGDGADTFVLNTSSNVNSFSTIEDLTTGDIIDLGQVIANASSFVASEVTLNDNTAVFQDFANAAVNQLAHDNDGYAWFQFDGDTYIVANDDVWDAVDGDFENGVDSIIKITGTVDLSTASYNSGDRTLEIA